MRSILMGVVMAVTATANGAGDAPAASGILHGKRLKFSEKGLAEGAKATIVLLESCHDLDAVTPALADLKKARQGDHVRLAFARPVAVTVLGKTFRGVGANLHTADKHRGFLAPRRGKVAPLL